jgi:hypothetical protein
MSALHEQFNSNEKHYDVAQKNVDAFLCASSIFAEAGSTYQSPATTEEERQLSARLHVLYGIPIEPSKRTCMPLHPYARARVYDLRRYNENTEWGPFMNDGSGRVDWEKVETIMVVLAFNLKVFTENRCRHSDFTWPEQFKGCSPNSYNSIPIGDDSVSGSSIKVFLPVDLAPLYTQPALPADALDPYGVTGTWRRVVCFLDYTDLYAFNFESDPLEDDTPRPPINTQEATRLITVKLYVTKIEPRPGKLPIVHFNGRSRSMHTHWDPNANSRVRGMERGQQRTLQFRPVKHRRR